MILKTEAIPIRIVPFGGSSHIVTWLTAEYGKRATVIKGACRSKRIGAGQYDLGYCCELLFYERERNGLHVFKDCTALATRGTSRGNWQKTAAISYLCLLAGTGSVSRAHTPGAYDALHTTLRTLDQPGPPIEPLLLWMELRTLQLHGVAPQLSRCTICNSLPDPHPSRHLLRDRVGGLICPTCRQQRPVSGSTVSTVGLRWLQQLQRMPRPPNAIPSSFPVADRLSATEANGPFLTFWLDLSPASRAVAYQMIHMQLQQKTAA